MSFKDILAEAHQMLLDRSKKEADLIYAIAKLDNEERACIMMAYRMLFEDLKYKTKLSNRKR